MLNLKRTILIGSSITLLTLGGCSITPRKFQSPNEAVQSLKVASQASDKEELLRIFGSDGEPLISSGDDVSDERNIRKFGNRISEKHELVDENGEYVLLVGEKEWPFPIPLVQSDDEWSFDTDAGLQEILDRRIGQNELGAIQVCDGFVDAQYEYAKKDRNKNGYYEYAQRIISTPGKMDGLYWEGGDERSPIGPFIASAAKQGYSLESSKPQPYHGYFYRILKEENTEDGKRFSYITHYDKMTEGFALVAYPADWGDSGIMTFIVNHEGRVYQKNLGKETRKVALDMNSFNPDTSWEPVD